MRQGVKIDGEYYLKVKSRILQVCASCQHRSLARHDSTCIFPCRLSSVVSVCVGPQIYCAEMQTDFPKEYVTLRSGQTDNYSEVYGHRWAPQAGMTDAAARITSCLNQNY